MRYLCADSTRRDALVRHPRLNGLDAVEVLDDPAAPDAERQRFLLLHFIKPVAPGTLSPGNIRIEGGERIRGIRALAIDAAEPTASPPASPPEATRILLAELDRAGDFSPYVLRLVRGPEEPEDGAAPPPDFDAVLSAIGFGFKAGCEAEADCRGCVPCLAEAAPEPRLDYLAKDYDSFRRLMLDRMAALAPAWRERSAADLGVALVEMLAHVADQLSWWQDAVATEAYLATARRRVSVRRHARLVDYDMQDGRSARALVQVELEPGAPALMLRREVDGVPTRILSRLDGPRVMAAGGPEHERARGHAPTTFELLEDVTLHAAQGRMPFHAWGALECCLPRGATRATLRGAFPELRRGDLLVLAEALGPATGAPEDADPTRRHPVRLTQARVTEDALGDPATGGPLPVTEVAWHAEDALPFPLTISARIGTRVEQEVSVALGNLVLADHGETLPPLRLPPVPAADPLLARVPAMAGFADGLEEVAPRPTPPRFRPALPRGPVTQAVPHRTDQDPAPSARATLRGPDGALPLPAVRLEEADGSAWFARRHLLASRPGAPDFVVETEQDGTARLRFGDGTNGARPVEGRVFRATWRIGTGRDGNVGADALAHLVTGDAALLGDAGAPVIRGIRNPLPAQGGLDPESLEAARQAAPVAFCRQERAVTPDDYAEMAARADATLQRAAGTLRWTGSWHTVFLTVDRRGGAAVDAAFEDALRAGLERYRLAGHDLKVDAPRFVALEFEAMVCVAPDHLRSDVRRALERALGRGPAGLFHPDRLSFGQPVHLGPILAAMHAVPGVTSLEVRRLGRLGLAGEEALRDGRIALGRLEIARLDNDPDFPERGRLALHMRGGR